MKRYWLMKLIEYDSTSKIETWKCLKLGADKPHELSNFLFNGYRIYDNKDNVVTQTKLDLTQWLKDNAKSQE
ncbi:hypothetical protein [Paenibacillus amylolyticus]|uniref:hypothetical protein n=2 Tax=Paenibacillus TaxID=44249 RepID=UPI000B867315|nr:hypothetical protein [Paenibacillus amylolyticus]